MNVSKKVLVVTGAGNGIGQELVVVLIARGAHVAAVDIDDVGLQRTLERAEAFQDQVSIHHLDVTDRKAVEALPDAVIAKHGQVDCLINNAGIIQPFVRVNDLDYEAIERVMNINFYGPLYLTKAFLPFLLLRPEAHIANVSSMGGFLPVPGQTVYGASKAAIKLFTEGLHSELIDTNVGVTVVFPGAIRTEITKNSGIDMNGASETETNIPMLDADKAAEIIVTAIEKDQYRVLVGNDARMMDTLTRVAPERAARLIYNQMKELLPA